MSKPMETRWFYHGPDNDLHGPYTGREMMMWVQSGYFKESLLIRTEHEERFHTLGEWTRITGKLPFTLPVMSLDHMMATMSINTMGGPPNPMPMNPMMMMPPGLTPPYPPPIRYAGPGGYVGVPPNPNMMTTSQPPSEPIDAGSLSHTPDSEQEGQNGQQQQQNNHHHNLMQQGQGDNTNAMNNILRHVSVMTAPQLKSSSTNTDVTTLRNVETQTVPIIVNPQVAARVLSELIGQKVIVA